MNQALLTFNSGAVSPYGRHRIDFDKTSAAAETLENFMVLPYGPAVKRPGLLYLREVLAAGANSRALPFTSSDGTHYLLHFTPGVLTIYGLDGTEKDTLDFLPGHTWAAPDDPAANLRAIQIVQLNDVAFLAHPAFHPMRLSRLADTTWTLENLPFSNAPVLDENADPTHTMAVLSATPVPAWATATAYTANVSIVEYANAEWVCLQTHTSSGAYVPANVGSSLHWKRRLFPPNHPVRVAFSGGGAFPSTVPAGSPGIYYRVAMSRDTTDMRTSHKAIVANDAHHSAPIVVQGKWNLFTHGTWHGTFTVGRSLNPVTGASYESIRSYTAAGDRNVADSGTEDGTVLLDLFFEKSTLTAATGDQGAYIIPESILVRGDLLIDYVNPLDLTQGTGTTQGYFLSGFTHRFAQGAFSPVQGYPRAIALHESRLWFAGTAAQPVSVWASQTDDFLNFTTGTNDTDAIFGTLAISAASPIRWLASHRRLFVGTLRGEWMIGADTQNAPISPTSFFARQFSSFGTMPCQPLIANDAIFFAERSGGRLRELAFDGDSYGAADLSRIAEHLTAPGLSNFAWQQTREPGLWIVRRDGRLLHLTYSRAERVAAFSEHTTVGGTFLDVVVFPGEDGDDAVFFVVQRGATTYLERIPAGWQKAIESESGTFHVDGIRGTSTGAIPIPAYLRNTLLWKTVGGVTTNAIIPGATLTITGTQTYAIGLPVTSRLVSLPIDTGADDGTTQARLKRPSKITLSVLHSMGGKVWNRSEQRAQSIPEVTAAIMPVSGWFDVTPDAGHLDDLQLKLVHSEPGPFVLRSATMRWNLTG